ncbi:chemotaxis protein CheW [Coleofasciculus sp. G2-EDA-02]|uniref:chemotaxis protein CheW n=1 Tax=Coleofasciculus sp. G2-EDA-02 TaxID=3069529 RepID=UPI0032F2317C
MSDTLSTQNLFSSSMQIQLRSPASVASETEQFLRFHLLPDTTALLSVRQLTEVLNIPMGQIVPIPHTPPWVMGVYNWRGEILWMVDVGHLVGLTPWYQQITGASNYTAIVLNTPSPSQTSTQVKSQILGLVVNRVEDIEWCNPDGIQSPPSAPVTPELAPFLRGYWVKSTGEMLAVLDGTAITEAMPKTQ